MDNGRIHASTSFKENQSNNGGYSLRGFDDVFIMVVCPLLHNAKLSKDSNLHLFGQSGWGVKDDNLTKVIMEALIIDGGLPKDQIAQKFICFRVKVLMYFRALRAWCYKAN